MVTCSGETKMTATPTTTTKLDGKMRRNACGSCGTAFSSDGKIKMAKTNSRGNAFAYLIKPNNFDFVAIFFSCDCSHSYRLLPRLLCNHNLISLWRTQTANANGKKETIKFQHLLAIHMTLTTYVVQATYSSVSSRVVRLSIRFMANHILKFLMEKKDDGDEMVAAKAVQLFASVH